LRHLDDTGHLVMVTLPPLDIKVARRLGQQQVQVALEWEPDDIKVWVDGQLTFETDDPNEIPHNPLFLAIQVNPTSLTASNQSSNIEVAWVKVFGP
jgi:hypothetical protein